ncbi:hypothetical protein CAPTEDRAFT_194714 [Capitella teleta]|uniref:Glycosyl transferase 64 domain-containing protein n=1 Tax=Capitella teleta TaxID=283909 RepID=R7VJV6_CAPTE|nr:hypothetical protein CAPTEDRAFT_194714 [Capitella teleta]|eukprot:ELU16230.1 hypothetical protein CAPTEDRAFT_194714 [Capitella teleta]
MKLLTRHGYLSLLLCVGIFSLIIFHFWDEELEFTSGQPFSDTERPRPASTSRGLCRPGVPCEFPEIVDLRVILLTFHRPDSLHKALNSLDALELDGDVAILEIFIDRYKNGSIHKATVQVADNFTWRKGLKRVHRQMKPVGIYGQWIDSWKPPKDSDELAIIVEDDVDLSPFAYRWLRQTHLRHGRKSFISGYTLQDLNIRIPHGKNINREVNRVNGAVLKRYPAYFFRVAGSWGFAPHPKRWREFQEWFHTDAEKLRHPYVPKARMNTNWYKDFERQHREDSMWTMWFIYFTDQHDLSTLVSNVPKFSSSKTNSLSCNRLEPGLHFKEGRTKSAQHCQKILMKSWSEKFVANSVQLPLIGYEGQYLGLV